MGHAVKEIETLMADEQRWKALPQEEQQEHETTFNQNSAHLQYLWQDDFMSVSKVPCEYLHVMMGTDSDDQSQTSDQP